MTGLAVITGAGGGLGRALAARWGGATLALWHDPGLTGTLFERDRDLLPPRSLKGRIKDRLLLRPRRAARVLTV